MLWMWLGIRYPKNIEKIDFLLGNMLKYVILWQILVDVIGGYNLSKK